MMRWMIDRMWISEEDLSYYWQKSEVVLYSTHENNKAVFQHMVFFLVVACDR